MSTRASVFEAIQMIAEVTPGTALAATKRFQSFDLDCDPQIPTDLVQPQGWKATTDLVVQKEWTKAGLKGMLCFNTLPYMLSGLLCNAAITTPSGNGTWTLTVTGSPAGGTFKLTFNSVESGTIAFNAAAATVQTALTAVSTVGSGNATVTGSAGGPWTVTFTGALVNTALALTMTSNALTGGSSPSVTVASTAASAARRWTFLPNILGADTYTTFSVEKGAASNAEKFAFGVFDALELDFNVKSASVKGDMLGGAITDGITMTSSPTDIAVKAVSPNTLDVYVGSTILGLTKLTKAFRASWGVKDRFKPVFTLDTSYASFTDVVEGKFNQTANIEIEQDSVANAFMTDLRARTLKYARIIATGGTIETGYPYRIQITFPFKFRNPKRQDKDGVYSGSYELEPVYDATLGGAVQVVIDTGLTAL